MHSALQTLSRRKLLGGLGLLIAAPAIVKASSLMPVRAYATGAPMTATEVLAAQRAYDVYWSGVSKWWTEAYSEQGKYALAIAAEPLRAGQPVVLR